MTNNVIKYKSYSDDYDKLMNLELSIIKNAYNNFRFPYSFALPNEITGMQEIAVLDGSQPNYADDFTNAFFYKQCGPFDEDGDYITLADYPRHKSRLRFLFKSEHAAQEALLAIKLKIESKHVKHANKGGIN